jgi:hypothetical protein
MALDTNIALGVRPIEQPNMLAQMGQMMQLRSAQQEYEGQNALRDAFASGGDFSDPAFLQRVRQANPKMAFDLEAKYLTGQKTRTEMLGTAYKNSKEFLTLVNSPEGLRDYTISQFSDPIIGPALKARGLTPEKALANLDTEIATSGFNTVLKKSALGLDNFIKEEMQTDRSRISAAPGHRTASITEQRFAQEQADRAEADRLAGRPSTPFVAPTTGGGGGGGGAPFALPMTGGSAAPARGGVSNALPAIVGAAPAAPASTNMLVPGAQAPAAAPVTPVAPAVAPTAAPASDPNTRIQAISAEIERLRPYMGNPKVATAVQQLATERTQLVAAAKQEAPTLTRIDDPTTPGQRLEINAREYKGGGLGSPGVLGVARTDKLTPQQTVKLKAEIGKDFKAVERTIAETDALLESIDAVRNSNLERVAGPIDARTFTMTNEGKLAETRFENLKGKVTAIAKTAATMTGAIGSIANQEWQILANQIAVLDLKNGKDPSLEQIDQLERQAMSIVNRMRDGFSRQYGEYLDELGPQYREIPNVTYTPGSAGYTFTGKKTPAKPRATPASTGNITDNAGVARVIDFGSMK